MDEHTVEQSFEKLEEIIAKMEDREISLTESFSLYKKGMEELEYCSSKIDETRKAVMAIQQDGTKTVFEED